MVRDENIIHQKAFWKKFFATRDFKEKEEFWLTDFMMTTNLTNYILEDNQEELRTVFRDTMEGQLEHDLYNKFFCNQLESDDEIDTLQQRNESWMVVVVRGGPIPNNV